MEITVKKSSKGCKLKIQGEMTIFNAVEIKEKLLASLLDSSKVEINLSEVNEMDTAGFQLLLMVKKEAEHLNKGFHVISPSPSANAAAELYRVNF